MIQELLSLALSTRQHDTGSTPRMSSHAKLYEGHSSSRGKDGDDVRLVPWPFAAMGKDELVHSLPFAGAVS